MGAIGERIVGEVLALLWCFRSTVDSYWSAIRSPFDQYETWRTIRRFTRCDRCKQWTQRQVYMHRVGLCDCCSDGSYEARRNRWIEKYGPLGDDDVFF